MNYVANLQAKLAGQAKTNPEPVNNLPLERNTNHDEIVEGGIGIDDALAYFDKEENGEYVDRHPEKRRKAAWMRYQEEKYAEMKAEFPTLKRSQINEKIFKDWQKAPENPMNQNLE